MRCPHVQYTIPALQCVRCVGCDIVQADHAPDGGVAQGVIHGVLVRHHGRNQEEVEGELGEEVKGQEEEDNAQILVRMTMTMDEMEIHCEALSQCDSVNKLDDSSTHGAHRARGYHVCVSHGVHVVGHSGLRIVEIVHEVVHNVP